MEQSLGQIDLSSLSSEESKEASAQAQEALQTLAQAGGDLAGQLEGISASVEGLQSLFETLQSYVEKTEGLKTAVDENPAPDLTGQAEDLAQSLEDAAKEQAREQAQEAAQNAAADAVQEAAEQAANATADGAKDAAEQRIRQSGALDGLGLTDEQIGAVKSQLIEEIRGDIAANTGDLPEINVEAEEIEISLDDLLAETLAGIQTELDARYGSIKEARDEVPDMEMPDLSTLDPAQLEALSATMQEMQGALGVIGEYAQGLSTVQDSLEQLAQGMEQMKTGVTALSQGSRGLTEGLTQFETAIGTAAEGSSQLNTALSQVSAAGGKLGSAYWQLVDGMNAFADGVSEFDEEGIQSLAELTGPEYMEVIRRVKAARDAEHRYNNFSGILDGQKGSVRFVIETDEIGTDA
jgi:putative membrane protein